MCRYTRYFKEGFERYTRFFEFVVADISALKNYISMTPRQKGEDLLLNHSYIIDEYTSDIISRAEEIDDTEMINLVDDYEWDQVVDKLFSDKVYKDVSQEISERVSMFAHDFDIPSEEKPSWVYFDNPQIIKNQWLIHFTNENPEDLQKYGFEGLVDDITRLGLTTYFSSKSSNRSKDGYGFSYLLSDYEKYGKGRRGRTEWKYGKNAVLFRASGVRVWHNGDEEYQTIFKGNTARDIIPIHYNDNTGTYQIENKTNKTVSQVIYENENLEKVVDWVVNNYDQYRKVL